MTTLAIMNSAYTTCTKLNFIMLLNCLLFTNSVLFANFANVSQKKIMIKQRSVTAYYLNIKL